MTYNVGDKVILKDNCYSEHGREAIIVKDDNNGYFIVRVKERYIHDFCADSNMLWCHCSMFA